MSFNTLPSSSSISTNDVPMRMAVIADMAYDNISDDTVKHLIDLTKAGQLDAVVHSGDIS